jgi:hypothetical protein
MKDGGQSANDDILDTRAVEPLKKLVELVHQGPFVLSRTSEPARASARFLLIAARGSAASFQQ